MEANPFSTSESLSFFLSLFFHVNQLEPERAPYITVPAGERELNWFCLFVCSNQRHKTQFINQKRVFSAPASSIRARQRVPGVPGHTCLLETPSWTDDLCLFVCCFLLVAGPRTRTTLSKVHIKRTRELCRSCSLRYSFFFFSPPAQRPTPEMSDVQRDQ